MPRDTFLPLEIAPGAWRNGSQYQAKGRWYDVNQVRWTNGRLRPIGGWQRFSPAALSQVPRGLHGWRANNQTRWLGIGTAGQLLVHDNTDLKDVTPLGFAVGRANSVYGLGWGAGMYGMHAYGTERPPDSSSIVLDAATWSFDNFGEYLVGCCTGDGRIYRWAPSQWNLTGDALKAVPLVNAPVGVAFVFVTEERHIVALGKDGNPRRVSWSSRENMTEWAAGPLNTAGDLDVTTPGKLMAAARWRNETLLFTDCDVHLMRYVRTPLIYGISQVGENNGIVGPKAVVSVGDRVCWMSGNGFWTYDGVSRLLQCDVQEHVFRDINMLQGAKICAGHNGEFGEVWWHYPSKDSVENDRYVIFNYREGWWTYGSLDQGRTAWIDKGVWTHVVAAAPNGHLYQHEDGWTASGVSRVGQVYAETGAIEIGRGERFAEVRQLIPDDCEDADCVAVSFKLRENPRGATFGTAGPYRFTQENGFCDARFAARQIEMRVESVVDADFHIGTLRADVVMGSGR